MGHPTDALSVRHRILVADEDPAVSALIVETLRDDGHAVLHALDNLSAVQLAFALECHLLISDTRVQGNVGIDLIHELRRRLPFLPVMYIANIGRSTPEIERQLPADVPIIREPFTADELRTLVRRLLPPTEGGMQ